MPTGKKIEKQNEERAKTFTDEFDDWDLNGRSEEIIKFISRQVLSAERQARREMLKKRLVVAQADRKHLKYFIEEEIAKARQEERQEIAEWAKRYDKRNDGINKSDLIKKLEEE